MLWVRADKSQQKASFGSSTISSIPAHTASSGDSRHHLYAKVRSRMNLLCNEICPRDAYGVMRVERSLGAQKRPPWCIAKVMHELECKFDASQLVGVKAKASKYIARNAQLAS
jgi:hypothetical protein